MKLHLNSIAFYSMGLTGSAQETICMTHELPFGNPVIQVQPGKLASGDDSDTDTVREAQERIRRMLEQGAPIPVAPSGDVTGTTGEQPVIQVQPGKLASGDDSDTDAVREAQERIRRMLEQGAPIPVAPSGDVTGTTGEQPVIQVQPGKLAFAIQPWFKKEPDRLEAEKKQMKKIFPQFSLQTLGDGRLAWVGKLRPGLMGRNGWDWHLMAVYNNDHPRAVMGGSVRIYLIRPDIQLLIDQLRWRPHHLLIDEKNNLYLCTTRAEDVHTGRGSYETTAIQALTWANKWLMGMELVLSGKMTKAQFDRPGGI